MIYDSGSFYKADLEGVEWRQGGLGRVCPEKFNKYLTGAYFAFSNASMGNNALQKRRAREKAIQTGIIFGG